MQSHDLDVFKKSVIEAKPRLCLVYNNLYPTLKLPSVLIGQHNDALSHWDVYRLNRLYPKNDENKNPCEGKCSTTVSVKCNFTRFLYDLGVQPSLRIWSKNRELFRNVLPK